jgi:hypothetical protein
MSEFWEHVARGSRGVRAAVALAGLWLGRTSVACGKTRHGLDVAPRLPSTGGGPPLRPSTPTAPDLAGSVHVSQSCVCPTRFSVRSG